MSAIADFHAHGMNLLRRSAEKACKEVCGEDHTDIQRSASGLCEPCTAMFLEAKRAVMSNMPVLKAAYARTGPHEDVPVMEYVIPEDLEEKPSPGARFGLYSGVIEPYIAHHAEVRAEGLSRLLLGNNGNGKTVALCYILLAMQKLNYSTYYITFPDLHLLYNQRYHDTAAAARLDEIQEVDFLAVDELHKETSHTGTTRQIADTWIKHREEYGRPTIIVSNEGTEVLRGDPKDGGYGRSFWAMLQQRYRVFNVDSRVNFRVRKRKVATW